MKVTLVGSRFFATSVLQALQAAPEVQIVGIVAPAADERGIAMVFTGTRHFRH